jgi:predicted GNAT family acetyltransferase
MELEVRDNPASKRYEIHADGELAGYVTYRERANTIELVHTQVEDAFGGKGVGSTLVQRTLDDIRSRGLELIPTCSFVKSFLERHAEYQDLAAG